MDNLTKRYRPVKDDEDSITFVHELTDDQIQQLTDLYEKHWWSKGRTREDITKMLQGCLSVCLVKAAGSNTDNKQLIGYTRVITDYVFKAIIFDVIVDEEYRGKGLGRCLLEAVLEHPDLAGIKHFELYCAPEMEAFYEKWGFSSNAFSKIRMMRKSCG